MPSTFAPITNLDQLDPEGVYTYADYLSWQFQERVDLIRGRLFPMSPAPNNQHQRILGNLYVPFWHFFQGQECQVFLAPFDVRLPVSVKKGQTTTVVQPDICVICDSNKLDEQGCNGAPDLVVEILSPGNSKREMREKYQVYEESGVREYWLVYPLDREVRIYILNTEGKFIGLAPVIEDDILHSSIFPKLSIDLKPVFAQ
jgi:Uma2 family endonuclease